MDKQDLRRARLKLWLQENELSVNAFADRIGRKQPQMAETLSGKRSFGEKLAQSIEELLPEMPRGYLVNPAPLKRRGGLHSRDEEQQKPQVAEGTPVVGTAKLGSDGTFYELEHPVGFGDGLLRYVSRDKNAYAVRVVGDSMSPRIRSGEFVVLEPNHKIEPGDDVLVVTTTGQQMVKEFLYERAGVVSLESVNSSHARINLPREQIEKMHYVVATTKDSAWDPG